MTCEHCTQSKKIGAMIVHCTVFGINVSKHYSGCTSRYKQEKGGKDHEQADHHRKPDA